MNTVTRILCTPARTKQLRPRVRMRLTKRVKGQVAKKVSGELPSGFTGDDFVAVYVRTFDNRVAFTETLYVGKG